MQQVAESDLGILGRGHSSRDETVYMTCCCFMAEFTLDFSRFYRGQPELDLQTMLKKFIIEGELCIAC